ncbi:MAG TPA: alpha/beta hydrolase family protein [Rickettsia endosymbiont of Bembidion nr. Transversale]|nr:alpha/beta hydrolase family protein [Rickettsia endosymbiont of Bembidion nr. Transversale]
MQNNDKYQKYFDLYNSYAKNHNLGNKYLELGEIVAETKYYRVVYYCSTNVIPRLDRGIFHHRLHSEIPRSSRGMTNKQSKTFLIIPSIFNSPEIFFLSRNKSFIENLREQGEVYLIDWLEVKESNYLLDDYVHKIVEVINNLNVNNINLIGHCIGGNLAIAANIIASKSIKTLTLLTCPWDFSHFFYIKMLHQYLKLDAYVENLPLIPKIHIQILFFLLFPDYFQVKLDKFFSLTSGKEQELAFRIENWLMSGHDIPSSTYNQIMQNILGENMFMNLKWKIDGTVIDPSVINCPVYIVAAKNDQIVPESSILSLQKLFKNSTLIEVPGGHISYLINDKLTDLFIKFLY